MESNKKGELLNYSITGYEQNSVRQTSFGTLSYLPDSMILYIFTFLIEEDLCCCCYVSRVFNIFAEEEELWKSLCIKKNEGNFLFKGTWKRTCLLKKNQFKPFPYKRIEVKGFYSDELYRKWYRCFVSMEYFSKLDVQQIERRSNLSLQEFIEKYDKPKKPVIITDIIDKWKAKQNWTKEKLLENYGNFEFKTDEVDYYGERKLYMMLKDYFIYAATNHDEDPIYLFDDKFGNRDATKSLLDDYEVPIYFKQDFFEVLGDERPPFRWLVIGPERSGSPFHLDPYRTSAWNALVVGRKRWAFYPHSSFPPGINLEFDEDGNFDHDSPEPIKWYLEQYSRLLPEARPLECILEAGEVIFVPSGWWHMVLNLEDTVAVTQNFCNQQNFEIVCAELDFDDEENYEEFRECLSNKMPNLQWPKRGIIKNGFKI